MFSRFCLLEIIVRPFISLMVKFEVYNLLASELEHFENGAMAVSIPLS